MKFRYEVLAGTGRLHDKAEVTVVLWVTPDLGGLQIERQAGVMRMYADEMRALENSTLQGEVTETSPTFEFEYKSA